MAQLYRLTPGEAFPPSSEALDDPNGLLAAGGVLDTATLLAAYRRGIFPWYESPQPVLWWTPDPRSVLFLEELHLSRSLRRSLRREHFYLSADQAFAQVVVACAAPRADQAGTWIGSQMLRAYTALHRAGWAHSVEVRGEDGALLGGLYGVAIGGAFFGESMFSRASDASKVALVALQHILRQRGFRFIDCQVESEHLNSLGARNLSRVDFENLLEQTNGMKNSVEPWTVPTSCGELL